LGNNVLNPTVKPGTIKARVFFGVEEYKES